MKYFILILILLFAVQCSEESLGTLQVSFQFNKAMVDDVEPSYQLAIWIENADSHYVKTLFLSEYLSYGGYNDTTICPAWSGQADWDNAPMEAYDAVTRATPPVGDNLISFGLDSLQLEPGSYLCCVQTHIIEDYNIIFKNMIEIGGTTEMTDSKAVFSPASYPGAEKVLTLVKTQIVKN